MGRLYRSKDAEPISTRLNASHGESRHKFDSIQNWTDRGSAHLRRRR